MVKVMKSHPEMAEIKWFNLVYLVLLSLGVCYSSQRELAAVKEVESYKQDNDIKSEGQWGIGGGVHGSIGGGIGIPGFTIGGGAQGGIGGGAHGGIDIPGFNIGGDVNDGVSDGGGIVVPGLGGDISGDVDRPCHGYDRKGVLVREWLGQSQYWNGNALRGTGQSLDFRSSALNENASINDSNSNTSKQDNNKQDSNQKEAYENKDKTAKAVAPNSGWADQSRT